MVVGKRRTGGKVQVKKEDPLLCVRDRPGKEKARKAREGGRQNKRRKGTRPRCVKLREGKKKGRGEKGGKIPI